MITANFEMIRETLLGYDRDQAYEDGVALIEQILDAYPDHARELYQWQMGFLSRLDRLEESIALFNEALTAGYWYHPLELEGDEMIALHGLPLFDELLLVNEGRYQAAQAEVVPTLRLYPPDIPAPYPMLMVLHGNQGNVQTTYSQWQSATQYGYLLALPQSEELVAPNAYFWNDTRLAIEVLRRHIEVLRRDFPIDWENSILAGFSGGGGLAAWLAFTNRLNIPLRGFMAMSPFIPDIEGWAQVVAQGKNRHLRGYIMVGTQDLQCIPSATGLQFHMQGQGLSSKLDFISGLKHHYANDFAERLHQALVWMQHDEDL